MASTPNPLTLLTGRGRQAWPVVLVVDDDSSAIELARASLAPLLDQVEIVSATSGEGALRAVNTRHPGLVLLDLVMPDVTGMEVLEKILEVSPGSEVAVVTANYSTDSAVEAIQKGAYDYITKPVPPERYRALVRRWLQQVREREQASELEGHLAEMYQFEGIVGRSPLILDLFARIERIAPHFTNALITGETGTGKELVARALHRLSPSREGPFVVCNCAAIAESLFESELFGHTRSAYTGAHSDAKGLIEHAAGGTLFLDEIGEVPWPAQAKLLRFIQNREVQRLGDPVVREVHVRVIAATNRDLSRMVEERTFREDLFYRLSMVQIKTPRLVDMPEDLVLLAHHFLRRFSQVFGKPGLRLSRRAYAMIRRHRWPGNVRELENALNYCAMMAEREVLEPEDFPETIRTQMREAACGDTELVTLAEMEARYAEHVVNSVGGNRVRAAAILGIGRATLYRILSRSAKAAS